jgi:hypothetical protein
MEEYGNDYRSVFPLWCELDILDAHDYREEFLDFVLSRETNKPCQSAIFSRL